MSGTVVHVIFPWEGDHTPLEPYELTPQKSRELWGFSAGQGLLCLTGRNSVHYFLQKLEAFRPDANIGIVRLNLGGGSFISIRKGLADLPATQQLSMTYAKQDLRRQALRELTRAGLGELAMATRKYEPGLFDDPAAIDALHELPGFKHLNAIAYSLLWEDMPVQVATLYDTKLIESVEVIQPAITLVIPRL